MNPNNITFKYDVDYAEYVITRRMEILYNKIETGIIVEVKDLKYHVEAYLWLRMRDTVMEVQPHMFYYKMSGTIDDVEHYICSEFRGIVTACENVVDMLRAEVETFDHRFEKINKLINKED